MKNDLGEIKMKKKVIIYFAVSISFLAVLVTMTVISFPRNIDRTFESVKFRLGIENADYAEMTSIRFSGKYSDGLFGHSFSGDIYENGSLLNANGMVTIDFNFSNQGLIYLSDSSFNLKSYGIIYIDNGFKKMSISLVESVEGSGEKAWSSEDGSMVAGSAMNREEALLISNELLSDFIRKPLE